MGQLKSQQEWQLGETVAFDMFYWIPYKYWQIKIYLSW